VGGNQLRNIASAIATLFFLIFFTFFLLRLAPGGPFDSDRAFAPEVKAAIDARYGLDQPLRTQFIRYISGLMRGDLGESFQYQGVGVTEVIGDSFIPSLQLGITSLLIATLLGLFWGSWAAYFHGSWLDHTAVFTTIAGASLPSYLVASVLILVFSQTLGWFPPALWEDYSSMVLPVLTLASRPLALIARLTRSSMLESLQSDYIRTARGKGCSSFRVVAIHALRNSLLPVVSLLGPLSANLLTGSFLVEVVFQVPGLGRHFVHAMMNRDYPLVMGVTLFYGIILVTSNSVTDVLARTLDPRIRMGNHP
jgi:oligopeptide transport system permease protein